MPLGAIWVHFSAPDVATKGAEAYRDHGQEEKGVPLKSSKTYYKTIKMEGLGGLGLGWVGLGWVKIGSVGWRWVALGCVG